MLLVGLAMFGVFFYNSLFIQNVLGFSAVQTGASFLPMTVLIILVAPIAGKYSDRVGSRWLVAVGMVLLSISLLSFSRLEATSNFWDILPGLLIGGFGMAIVMTPITAAAMGSVPVDKAGVGSAVLNSGRQVGGSLGIAVMGAIVAASATGVPGTPEAVEGFVTGYQHALQVAAAIALAGAVLSVATIRKYRHEPEPRLRRRVSTIRLPAEERRASLLDAACRLFRRPELPRHDDGRPRPRRRRDRAGSLPALSVEARALSRLHGLELGRGEGALGRAGSPPSPIQGSGFPRSGARSSNRRPNGRAARRSGCRLWPSPPSIPRSPPTCGRTCMRCTNTWPT